jgi:uncharacterized membrane protein YfcA
VAVVVVDASALVEVLPQTSRAPAHTNSWLFWLGVELPVVIVAVLLLFPSRKHLRERQRIWKAGFIVVLCGLGAGVALLAQVSMDALMLVASAFILGVSIRVLWRRLSRRHHAGALLLDLELGPSRTGWWSSLWLWYGLTVFSGNYSPNTCPETSADTFERR